MRKEEKRGRWSGGPHDRVWEWNEEPHFKKYKPQNS